MTEQKTVLVFGGTGQTGQHLVRLCLDDGLRVRALVRNPAQLGIIHPDLEVVQGSITDPPELDALVEGCGFVVSMLGDATTQRNRMIVTDLVRQLVPAMRRNGVSRLLHQAGGLSAQPHRRLPPALWLIRHTIARSFDGQHKDNEAVMRYLADEANDIEWIVHRAGIGSDGPSRGVLERSQHRISIATFRDCAAYNLRTVQDAAAIHTCDGSRYASSSTGSP
jgi:putative NADH-flavin reductase